MEETSRRGPEIPALQRRILDCTRAWAWAQTVDTGSPSAWSSSTYSTGINSPVRTPICPMRLSDRSSTLVAWADALASLEHGLPSNSYSGSSGQPIAAAQLVQECSPHNVRRVRCLAWLAIEEGCLMNMKKSRQVRLFQLQSVPR